MTENILKDLRFKQLNEKYIIDTPDDSIITESKEGLTTKLYVPPYGPEQINCIIDYIVEKGGYSEPYHYFKTGIETFIIMKGRVETIMNGKKFELEEGDILTVEAWCPYRLKFIGDNTVVRVLRTARNDSEVIMLDPVNCDDVDKSKVNEVTGKDQGIYSYMTEGIRLDMKVGRWQLDGYKEVWEYRIKKGYKIYLNSNKDEEGLYLVSNGQLGIQINGKEDIDAINGQLIYIPSGTAYSIEALSKDAVLLDLNVTCHLFRLLEMIEAAQDYFPEKLKDEGYLDHILKINDGLQYKKFERV